MTSRSLVIVGTFFYVLAWLLPAYKSEFGLLRSSIDFTYRGWKAFWVVLTSEWPSKGSSFSEWYGSLLCKASALSNCILAETLLDFFVNATQPHPVLRTAMFVCVVLNTIWLVNGALVSLRIGYYLWAGSFFLIAAGLATSRGAAQGVSTEHFFDSELIAISATYVLVGIYVALILLEARMETSMTEDSERRHDKVDAKQASANPLSGKAGVVIFVILVLLTIGVDYLVCSDDIELTSIERVFYIQAEILVVVLGWLAFAMAKDGEEFFHTCIHLGIVFGPIVAMILTLKPGYFWISISIISAGCLLFAYNYAAKGLWSKTLVAIYTLWVVVGAFVTLGSTSYLPYSKPATELSEISFLLNIRYVLTALFMIASVGDAIRKAFRPGMPDVRDLPWIRIPESSAKTISLLYSIFRPFVIAINVLLLVLQKVTNVIWQLLVLISVYLYRTGKHLGNHFVSLIFDRSLWHELVRIVITFSIVLLLTLLTNVVLPSIVLYMRSNTSLSNLSLDKLNAVFWIAGYFLLTSFVIIIYCTLWKIGNKPISRTAFAGSTILLTCWLSGIAMYVLARISLFSILGFNSFGVFSLLITGIVGGVSIRQVAKYALSK